MENRPRRTGSNTLLLIILFVLLAVVIALAGFILVLLLDSNQTPPPAMQMTTEPTAQTTSVPTVTIEPTPTVEVTAVPATEEPTPSPSPSPTATPIDEGDVMWTNIEYLNIRPEPDFSYERIISIPYGVRVTGEISGKWMYITYKDVTGWIYIGEVKNSDRPCAVPTEAELWPKDW